LSTIVAGTASGAFTPYAKRQMASDFCRRGMHFYAAAVLLRQNGGDGYVVLHLKCQGIELVLKGWLLLRNFDKYKSKIRAYSHNLERLVRDALVEFKRDPLPAEIATELQELSQLFSSHEFRYSFLRPVFVDLASISTGRVEGHFAYALQVAARCNRRWHMV
jgi:hypothetical protein